MFPRVPYDFAGTRVSFPDITRFVGADPLLLDDLSTYSYYRIRDGERPDVVSNQLYGTPSHAWTLFAVNESLREGMAGWPLSQQEFEDYMDLEYGGTVIETRPTVVYNSDGIVTEYRDSLAGRFSLENELVVGSLSGATGRVASRDEQTCQLVLRDVSGSFRIGEAATGQTTQDSVTAYRVWDGRLAPHHYEDGSGRVTYNALHASEQLGTGVQPGTSDSEVVPVSNLAYETALNDSRADIRVVRPELVAEFVRVYEKLLDA